jgi:hypothetical protein
VQGRSNEITEDQIQWVRWNAPVRAQHPEIEAAIAAFDPGTRPAAQDAAAWLRQHGLDGESQPYLAMVDGELVGFYALTAGEVELSRDARKKLGLSRPTQGAILVTWVAKSTKHVLDGDVLVNDAIGIAQETAQSVSATVIALDPFDEGTAEMWRTKFKMRNSRTSLPAREGEPTLKRMFLPLRSPELELDSTTGPP